MGVRLSSRVGLATLVAFLCITKPSRASLIRVLAAFASRRTGFFGGALTRGALAFSEFAAQLGSPDAIVLHDLTLCTVATADAAVCTDIFNDESRCAFVGILGHWFCVRYARQQRPDFMCGAPPAAHAPTARRTRVGSRVLGAQIPGLGPRLSNGQSHDAWVCRVAESTPCHRRCMLAVAARYCTGTGTRTTGGSTVVLQ